MKKLVRAVLFFVVTSLAQLGFCTSKGEITYDLETIDTQTGGMSGYSIDGSSFLIGSPTGMFYGEMLGDHCYRYLIYRDQTQVLRILQVDRKKLQIARIRLSLRPIRHCKMKEFRIDFAVLDSETKSNLARIFG